MRALRRCRRRKAESGMEVGRLALTQLVLTATMPHQKTADAPTSRASALLAWLGPLESEGGAWCAARMLYSSPGLTLMWPKTVHLAQQLKKHTGMCPPPDFIAEKATQKCKAHKAFSLRFPTFWTCKDFFRFSKSLHPTWKLTEPFLLKSLKFGKYTTADRRRETGERLLDWLQSLDPKQAIFRKRNLDRLIRTVRRQATLDRNQLALRFRPLRPGKPFRSTRSRNDPPKALSTEWLGDKLHNWALERDRNGGNVVDTVYEDTNCTVVYGPNSVYRILPPTLTFVGSESDASESNSPSPSPSTTSDDEESGASGSSSPSPSPSTTTHDQESAAPVSHSPPPPPPSTTTHDEIPAKKRRVNGRVSPPPPPDPMMVRPETPELPDLTDIQEDWFH